MEEVTAVVAVQVPSWQVAGMLVVWWALGWGPVWVLVTVPVPERLSKQTLDVALDQGHQTRAVAWVGLNRPAAVWGVHASKVPGIWYPPQIGLMSEKAEETTTERGTIMWVRELVASLRKLCPYLMGAACGHVACSSCHFFCSHFY